VQTASTSLAPNHPDPADATTSVELAFKSGLYQRPDTFIFAPKTELCHGLRAAAIPPAKRATPSDHRCEGQLAGPAIPNCHCVRPFPYDRTGDRSVAARSKPAVDGREIDIESADAIKFRDHRWFAMVSMARNEEATQREKTKTSKRLR
jgi:hypothetical protein